MVKGVVKYLQNHPPSKQINCILLVMFYIN